MERTKIYTRFGDPQKIRKLNPFYNPDCFHLVSFLKGKTEVREKGKMWQEIVLGLSENKETTNVVDFGVIVTWKMMKSFLKIKTFTFNQCPCVS